MVAAWLAREKQAAIDYLKQENKVRSVQLGGKRIRFTDAQRRRLARKGKLVGRRGLHELGCIVTPETILRWYRQLVAQSYDGSSRRALGRPRTANELRALVVSMAVDNPTWGYTRLRDVLRTLGHDIGRTTIQTILKEQGIEPAPSRRKQMTWSELRLGKAGCSVDC